MCKFLPNPHCGSGLIVKTLIIPVLDLCKQRNVHLPISCLFPKTARDESFSYSWCIVSLKEEICSRLHEDPKTHKCFQSSQILTTKKRRILNVLQGSGMKVKLSPKCVWFLLSSQKSSVLLRSNLQRGQRSGLANRPRSWCLFFWKISNEKPCNPTKNVLVPPKNQNKTPPY